jgi:hypothetical protein
LRKSINHPGKRPELSHLQGKNRGARQRLTLPEGATKGKAKEELRGIEEQVAREWLEYERTRIRETTWEC